MDLLKGIALFIGWVTSSFAGIGAILYACGYLVSRAQLRTLGLFGLFEHSPDYYLQEGANFFVLLAVLIVDAGVPWLIVGGYAVLALLVVSIPLEIFAYRRREHLVALALRLHDRAAALLGRQPGLWRAAALTALFLLLVLHILRYLDQFSPALEISNLLYADTAVPSRWEPVRGWLLQSQRDELEKYFRMLMGATLQAAILLALAARVASATRWKAWLIAPFAAVFMMYTLFLPMAYGALLRPLRFAVVRLVQPAQATGVTATELFLLNKTEREFVVWDRQARRVLWIPNSQVSAAEVSEIRSLFESPRSSKGGE